MAQNIIALIRDQVRQLVDPLLIRFREELYGSGVSYGKIQPSALPPSVITTTGNGGTTELEALGYIKGITTYSGGTQIGDRQTELAFENVGVYTSAGRTTIVVPILSSGNYYTQSQTNTLLATKAALVHNHVAADITDWNAAVAAAPSVVLNTAKVTNATHTGDVIGSSALTIQLDAVTLDKIADSGAITGMAIVYSGGDWVAGYAATGGVIGIHAYTHASGGIDELFPADIGAATQADHLTLAGELAAHASVIASPTLLGHVMVGANLAIDETGLLRSTAPSGMQNPMVEAGDIIVGITGDGGFTNIARTALGAIASDNGTFTTYVPSRAFDDDDATDWNGSVSGDAWIRIDLLSAQTIQAFRIFQQGSAWLRNFVIESSNDNGTWIARANDFLTGTPPLDTDIVPLSVPITARYWRWHAPGSSLAGNSYGASVNTFALYTGGTAGDPVRLGIGSEAQVLTVVSGLPAWANSTGGSGGGFATPMTTIGDMIFATISGVAERLPIGSTDQVLTTISGLPIWQDLALTISGALNPLSANGDMIIGVGGSGDQTRLPIGSEGQVLTTISGLPSWQTPSGGGGGSSVIHTDAYASPPSSPSDGDTWIPSDSPYSAYRVSGAWLWRRAGGPVSVPDQAGLTSLNMGPATLTNNGGALNILTPATNSSEARILKIAIPSSSFKFRVGMSRGHYSVNYASCGIIARESSSGKYVTLVHYQGNGIMHQYYNGYTNGYAATPYGPLDGIVPDYFEIEEDATNRYYRVGRLGFTMMTILTQAKATWCVTDEVGIYVDSNNGTYPASIDIWDVQIT